MDRLADTIIELTPPITDERAAMVAERVSIDLPVELYFRDHGDDTAIESSAPTQRIATSVLPVFHRIRVVLEATKEWQSD